MKFTEPNFAAVEVMTTDDGEKFVNMADLAAVCMSMHEAAVHDDHKATSLALHDTFKYMPITELMQLLHAAAAETAKQGINTDAVMMVIAMLTDIGNGGGRFAFGASNNN